MAPKNYNIIDESNCFYLSAGESIPLVFRYLSFSSSHSQKEIAVTVTKEENHWIAGGFTLIVDSHESVVNHSYMYKYFNKVSTNQVTRQWTS